MSRGKHSQKSIPQHSHGSAGRKFPATGADFTEKSHSFYGGETLRKQVVLLNDLRQAADYSYELRLVCDGEELAMRRGTGIIDAAGKLLLPVEFKLPATGKKRDAELRLLRPNQREHP